ncbi:Hpt domain-containing protein [Opitutus sp. ER46]|uniref:Hpt domain-containing protein n=1 Tax=Opitutus sp. ER46 TaxID=2161864 RepID=UPI000D31F5F4|nr:Hpt domain-containing protein [Opitutus sp. ER46]PTX91613.1 hypothetical protein DB354_17220 [Opitutus sp. ER46]
MPGPLNRELTNLVSLLGEQNVRQLVRTFLKEYPELLAQLATSDRRTQHRMVHSLKSNAHIIGEQALWERMAAFEERLLGPGDDILRPDDIEWIGDAFNAAADPLREFAAGAVDTATAARRIA